MSNDNRNNHWDKDYIVKRKLMYVEIDKLLVDAEKYIRKNGPKFIRKELGFK